MKKFLDRYFHISEKGSTIAREILAGVIVFFAMIYILPVNQSILGNMGPIDGVGIDPNGVFAATAIASAISTIIMGVVAKYPVMLSAGMGMNAYIAFTVCGTLGYTWVEALALLFITGVLFLIITLTPIRTWIINAIPQDIKYIISAGLGCFIAFVGLKMSGLIKADVGTLVSMGDLQNPVVLLSLFGILLVFALLMIPNKKIKQLAIVIAMLATALVGFILGLCGVENMPTFVDMSQSSSWLGAFKGLGNVFGKCFDGNAFVKVLSSPSSYAIIFSLIFVNMFDTTATLVAVGKDAGILDNDGQLIGGKKAMLADAVGAVICAPLGTSTVTSFAESTVATESGARTGLSATVTGFMFLISLVIYPIFSIFSAINVDGAFLTPVTSMALVAVGAMMFTGNLKSIKWDDKIIGFTAFLCVVMMMLTYSISNGLGFALIAYCIMMLVAKRGKEINIVLYIVAGLFAVNFAVTAIMNVVTSSGQSVDLLTTIIKLKDLVPVNNFNY